MEKRTKILLCLAAVHFVLIGGYFLAKQFGILPEGKINYVQTSTEIKGQEITEIANVPNQESQINEKKEINVQPSVSEDKKNVEIENENIAEKVEEKTPEKVALPAKDDSSGAEVGKVINKLTSWGYTKATDRKIDTMIVHSSYDSLGDNPYSVSGIIDIYRQYEVSAHYLIARDGVIYRLVEDKNIAWHAGASKMPDGRTNVNDFSIGVEMINTKDGKYTDEQYDALNELIASLKNKYSIKNILGHDDIAPGRKTDPWGIEWNKVDR